MNTYLGPMPGALSEEEAEVLIDRPEFRRSLRAACYAPGSYVGRITRSVGGAESMVEWQDRAMVLALEPLRAALAANRGLRERVEALVDEIEERGGSKPWRPWDLRYSGEYVVRRFRAILAAQPGRGPTGTGTTEPLRHHVARKGDQANPHGGDCVLTRCQICDCCQHCRTGVDCFCRACSDPECECPTRALVVTSARSLTESVDHEFQPSYTGMVCERMVMRDGAGDQCGLPQQAHGSECIAPDPSGADPMNDAPPVQPPSQLALIDWDQLRAVWQQGWLSHRNGVAEDRNPYTARAALAALAAPEARP